MVVWGQSAGKAEEKDVSLVKELKKKKNVGHLVAHLVKGLSLDFGSGRDPRIVTSNCLWGFTPRVEPA